MSCMESNMQCCGKQNHFAKACQSKGDDKQGIIWYFEDEEASIDSLVVHLVFDPATDTYKLGNNNACEEVEATLIPVSLFLDQRPARDIPAAYAMRLRIYPHSGATICLGGPKHWWHMELLERILVPLQKKVYTFLGFSLVCQSWLPIKFIIGERTMKQALCICKKVQVTYLSKVACIDASRLPLCFPKPMTLPLTYN